MLYGRIGYRVKADTRIIFVMQCQVGMNTSFITQVDIVIRINLKRPVNKYRVIRMDMQADSFILQGPDKSDICTSFLLVVQVFNGYLGFFASDISIHQDIESLLILLGRALYSAFPDNTVCGLTGFKEYCINRQAVCCKACHTGIAAHSLNGRCIYLCLEFVYPYPLC